MNELSHNFVREDAEVVAAQQAVSKANIRRDFAEQEFKTVNCALDPKVERRESYTRIELAEFRVRRSEVVKELDDAGIDLLAAQQHYQLIVADAMDRFRAEWVKGECALIERVYQLRLKLAVENEKLMNHEQLRHEVTGDIFERKALLWTTQEGTEFWASKMREEGLLDY
jgi:hypothetical protein